MPVLKDKLSYFKEITVEMFLRRGKTVYSPVYERVEPGNREEHAEPRTLVITFGEAALELPLSNARGDISRIWMKALPIRDSRSRYYMTLALEEESNPFSNEPYHQRTEIAGVVNLPLSIEIYLASFDIFLVNRQKYQHAYDQPFRRRRVQELPETSVAPIQPPYPAG